eukprot:c24853_g2_i2 orf=292-1137(+)
MERKFSMDDILGSYWKREANSIGGNINGELSYGLSLGGENLAMESNGFTEDIGKKMSRIDSVFAFQEFLKNHSTSADSARPENVSKQEIGKAMSRIDSVWAFQEFLKSNVFDDADAASTVEGREGDADEDRIYPNPSPNLNTSHSHTQADVHNDEKYNPNLTSGDSHKPLDPRTPSAMEDCLIVEEQRENFCNGSALSKSPIKGGSSITEINEFPEQQVSGALNPLFTGLKADTNTFSHRNPQEYEVFLKRQLDMACAAFALTRGCNSLKAEMALLVLMIT